MPTEQRLRTSSARKTAILFLAVLLVSLTGLDRGPLNAQDERAYRPEAEAVKVREGDSPDEKAGEAGEEGKRKNPISPQMDRLFPIGRPFRGVRIPSYTGDSLTSVVHAEVMRRIDKEHLDLEQLVITSFSEGEEPDTRIYMDRAIYDIEEGKLISQSPTRIVQPEFEMVGDRMVFDNETQIGHMTGNVKMRIFTVDQVFSGGMLGGSGSEETQDSTPSDE